MAIKTRGNQAFNVPADSAEGREFLRLLPKFINRKGWWGYRRRGRGPRQNACRQSISPDHEDATWIAVYLRDTLRERTRQSRQRQRQKWEALVGNPVSTVSEAETTEIHTEAPVFYEYGTAYIAELEPTPQGAAFVGSYVTAGLGGGKVRIARGGEPIIGTITSIADSYPQEVTFVADAGRSPIDERKEPEDPEPEVDLTREELQVVLEALCCANPGEIASHLGCTTVEADEKLEAIYEKLKD